MKHIEINPKIMLGKPVITGTRITVEQIISLLAQDNSIDDILQEYKGIQRESVLACLQYAENIMHNSSVFDLDKIAS
jgi:uncharacterized protein (DUF433 family)